MDLKRINAGKLRAIGYDPRTRCLRVELDDGSLIDYAGVGDEAWRRLSSSSSPWSHYRDNIEEEFPATRLTARATQQPGAATPAEGKKNPLDDLFGGG
ncbi:MAG: KTSC domain-containing protein [Rhodocyclaceae bacterium]